MRTLNMADVAEDQFIAAALLALVYLQQLVLKLLPS